MNLLGTMLGNYRIDRLLGEGGMGTVYQAHDISLQREVAIKLIHPHLARSSNFRERFIQEARLMAHLDHPGIVRVFHLGVEGDMLYLPMEFIKGGNLRQLLDELIRKQTWLPLDEALLLVGQLCQTVEYAHQHGVLHRDIKPANLMLKPEPTGGLPFRVILTDLGLAKLLEGLGMTQEGTSLGTPAYMSPEQASGQPTDPRSDVYSLGILLYELCVGRLPFQIRSITEAMRYHAQVQPPAPRSVNDELPETLERVILKALEKDPGKRYPSAAQLGAVLSGDLGFSTEIAEPADKEGLGLITEYQKSIIAPPRPGSTSLMTIIDSGSLGPRGDSIFEGKSIPPGPETRIQLIYKDTTAKVFTVSSSKVTLGRDSDNTIVLDDTKASRHHVQILWDGMEYHVMDLNSRNGTFLEDSKLLPGVSAILRPNQVLQIGDTWLRLIQPTTKPPSISGPTSMGRHTLSFHTSAGAGLVGVQVTPQQLEVEAGGSVTATISLLNQSPNVDHFSLSLTGFPNSWVVSLPPSVQLMPADQKEESFTLQVPRSSQSRAGSYPLTLRVTSQRDASQFVEMRLTLTVAAYSQFRTELQPQRLRVGQIGRLTVSNQGNRPEMFSVKFTDDAEELALHPPQFDINVPEGKSATQEFRAQLRHPRWVGGEKTHSFRAQIGIPKGEPLTLQAEMLSRGLLPVWVPPIVLLLCCLLMVTAARFIPAILTPPLTATLTASATTEPGAPIAEEWCIYPSDQPPPPCTDFPFQVNAVPGQTLTIQWRVSNAQEVIIEPIGNQELSGTRTYVVTENMPPFKLKANNAEKAIEKQIQVIVVSLSATPMPTTPAPTTQAATTEAPPTQAPPTQAPPTQAPPTPVPPTPVPPAQPIEISQTDGQASAWFGEGNAYVNVGQGQSFVVKQAATIKEFSIYLQGTQGNAATDQIICDLRNASMAVLQSSSINGFSGGEGWQSFAFNIGVNPGTYIFTCYLHNSYTLEQHTYGIHGNANDNSYLEGTRYTSVGGHPEDGSTWTASPWDLKFIIKMEIQP